MKIHKILLFAVILVLLNPDYAAPQYDPQVPAFSGDPGDSIKNPKLIERIRADAESGDLSAQYFLGRAYLQGDGVGQDTGEALKWFRKAAKNGHSMAQLQLGMMYFQGNGVKQSYKDAVKWFRKAADERSITAQINLGKMYLQGKGVKQDYPEAEKLFLKAAEKGNASVQYMLGAMYANGLEVTQDYLQAYVWLTMSIKGSKDTDKEIFENAMELRESIGGKISPQQAAEAERQVEEWFDEGRTINDVFYMEKFAGIPPVVLVQPLPRYTDQARDAHVGGACAIQCIVRKNGTADNCEVLREFGYGMDKSAVKIVENEWRFEPGTYKGKPVDVIVEIKFEFSIY